MKPTVFSLLLAVAASGCATLFNAGQKTIPMASMPSEAEVWIDGTLRGVTPLSLELNNHTSHVVVFKKEGYKDVTCNLDTEVGARWVILDVLGGLAPVIVDAATGAWRSLSSETCNVTLPAREGSHYFALLANRPPRYEAP